MIFSWLRLAAIAAAMAVTMPSPAAGPNGSVPSAEAFGARPQIENPKLSPDGRRIVARGNLQGKAVLLSVILEPDGGRSVHPIPIPDGYTLEWYRWAGDTRIIASFGSKERFYVEDYPVTRALSIDLATGKQMLIGPREQGFRGDDVIHIDPEGRYLLLNTQPNIREYPSVYRVDLTTGKSERIVKARENVWDWYADRNGVVRVGIGTSNGKWWLYYRGSESDDFERSSRRDTDNANGIEQISLDPKSGQGVALANGPTGRFGLYRYDFATDMLGEPLYAHADVDVDSFDMSREGELRSVSYTVDRPEIAWFDATMRMLQKKIDAALPDAINRIVSASRDSQTLLIWSGSASDPGAYYLFDRKANRLSGFAQPYEELAGAALAQMEPVRYRARDGLEIRGYLTLPLGERKTGLPLIVMPHGGPFARDSWGYDPWVQFLASRGYVVLQPNFRGSTGFGRDYVDRGTGEWGRGMQDDLDDGVRWLVEKGVVDAGRVCIMGASYGGYAAMWAAVRNPDIYRCAISFAGISDVASMLRYDRGSFSAPRYFRDWRTRVRGDDDFRLDEISPIKSVDRIGVPLLIAHGDKDDNVPLYQSRRLHDALERRGYPHEYVVYRGEGHGLTDPANATDFLLRIEAFLGKHNPP